MSHETLCNIHAISCDVSCLLLVAYKTYNGSAFCVLFDMSQRAPNVDRMAGNTYLRQGSQKALAIYEAGGNSALLRGILQ